MGEDSKAPTEKNKVWYRTNPAILALVIIGGVSLFLLLGKGCGDQVFTQYGPLPTEESTDYFSPDTSVADTLSSEDTSVMITKQEKADEEETRDQENKSGKEKLPVKDSSGLVDLFKVNTHFEKISSSEVAGKKSNPSPAVTTEQGLFEELLMSSAVEEGQQALFENYYAEHILSSKSVLKLLSVSGQHLLLGNSNFDYQSILDILTESDQIQGIFIVDRNGRINYATNQKYLHTDVLQVLPQIDLQLSTITWYQAGEQNIATLPLYHTYGRIGTAVLITVVGEGK